MIEKLRGMAIFATVVDQGTFRAAASHLGLAPSRISESVSDLEKQLGVTLLYRSTRQLSLTNEGRILYAQTRNMLDAAETGLDAISPMSKEPSGVLRVTAPAFVTQTDLIETFARFAAEYPKVSLDFHFTDHPMDLIKEGYDVGIRAGWLEDSELLTRNIGHTPRMLVASPDYIARKPTATHPSDLEDWDWVRFVMRSNYTELTSAEGEVVSVLGKSNITVNSVDSLYEFCTRDHGLTALPGTLANKGFERGDLVHVLPDWSLRALGLHAVWPDQSRRENLTQLFVRYLAAEK